jgi:hypothetical protein
MKKTNPPFPVWGIFFHRNIPVMTFYLIFPKNELHVVPVRPKQEIVFFQLHGQRILFRHIRNRFPV